MTNTTRLLTILAFLVGKTVFCQQNLPTIKATSKIVDFRIGDEFYKGAGKLDPENNPNISQLPTSFNGKKITFYTDKDSISTVIKPKIKFEFLVELNDTTKISVQISLQPLYLDTLKQSGNYDYNDLRVFPSFTYQAQNDSNLMVLRSKYKLDSIAGNGNEVSKILNLMHWVHNLIPHDGNHDFAIPKNNALTMIEKCNKDKHGLTCRGLATVLNDCYLSMGIPSRHVTGMPRDSVFQDCHVINMVYVRELQKWIYIDPTNDAYVMNENGELLSIEEVRDRLINNKVLILNPDANWNRKISMTKEEYLYNYMAKNLYRLQCPVESRFDYETREAKKTLTYVELLSDNAFKQKSKRTENETKGDPTSIYYITNNPNKFWAKPE